MKHYMLHATMQMILKSYANEISHRMAYIIWFLLYEVSRIGKFTEIECILVVVKGWG